MGILLISSNYNSFFNSKMSKFNGLLLGVGNPLLDISAEVGQEMLDKYDVKLDAAILAEEKHLPVYDDLVKKKKKTFIFLSFFSFFSLDRCSIPSREVSILCSYLDIILLFFFFFFFLKKKKKKKKKK